MKLLFFPTIQVNQSKLQQQLHGKRVLITGASYGIGESLAIALAKSGAHLILVARTAEKLSEVQQRVEAMGGQAEIIPCDLTKADEVQMLIDRLRQQPDGIDIFVSNAGKSIRRSIFDSLDRMHDFTRTMNLNYFAPVQLMLALIPGLIARQGHVINISALNVGLPPMPQWAAYQASKTAFDQWFRSVAAEINRQGVATTSIYLPLVKTRMIEPTAAYKNMPAMQPEEVAQLICHALLTRKRRYAPWWLGIAEMASLLFRGLWERTR